MEQVRQLQQQALQFVVALADRGVELVEPRRDLALGVDQPLALLGVAGGADRPPGLVALGAHALRPR